MAQHDWNLANAAGAAFRADANDALAALATLSSGATTPTTTVAYQLWADTTAGLLKQRNAANSGWIIRNTLSESRVISRSTNTALGAADFGRFITATAAFTQTFNAASILADGWFCFYRVESAVTVTLDPNSSELVDGATTKAIVGPASGVIFCDGSALRTVGFPLDPVPTGTVIHVAQTSAPTGYLKANGAAVSRTVYAALFSAIGTTFGAGDGSSTFNLPDLRGEFVRGWDDARGVDSGRAIGSAQAGMFGAHSHAGSSASTASAGSHSHTIARVDDDNGSLSVQVLNGGNGQTVSTNAAGDHTHTVSVSIASDGGAETRPRNVALLAVIKF
jgi:phage-related tail fiber protein